VLEPFPSDWRIALLLVPHPDDPEYGCAAAVAKWTGQGKTVRYALACRGEKGIDGMPPEQAGPLREAEQLRSAAVVGVSDVQFWDFPDSRILNTAELRATIAETITTLRPDVVLSIYGGPEWAPGAPNQRDHIEFAAAVLEAYDELTDPPRWLFQNGPDVTHAEVIDDAHYELAVASLAPGVPVGARPHHTGDRAGPQTGRHDDDAAAGIRRKTHGGIHLAPRAVELVVKRRAEK
jgi:LmbE family N-acetylglucosaminyl deacetylase